MKKYYFWFETFFLIGILTIINLVWYRHNLGFTGISPHPYWIVILAISIKYEFRQALTVAVLSSIFYTGFLFYNQKIASFSEIFNFEHFRYIMLFIIVGGFIGQIRSNHNNKLKQLQKDFKESDTKYNVLKKNFEEIRKIKDELSERVIDQTSSVTTVYHLAKKLNVKDVKEIIPVSLEFVLEFIGAEKCSFYLAEENKLKLAATRGWLEKDQEKYEKNINNELVRRAINSRKVVALTDIFDEKSDEIPEHIESNVVMSVPITIGHEKSIFGLLNVEKLPFLKFNIYSIKLFNLIGDWISNSVTFATEMQNLATHGGYLEQQKYIEEKFSGRFKFGSPLAEMRRSFK